MANWDQTPAAITIHRTDAAATPPPESEQELTDKMVSGLAGFVGFWQQFKDHFLGPPKPNSFVGPIARDGGWGYNGGGRFQLADDQALIVTTRDGSARYTRVQISDPWAISPDPVHHLSSLNKSQSLPNPDGTYTYVIALRDAGVHNWIDTVGLYDGWYMLRWQNLPKNPTEKLFVGIQLVEPAEIEKREAAYARRTASRM